MTQQLRTIAVLAVEAVLLIAMVGSYVYFIHNSRDFIAASRPVAAISILHNRPR